MVTVTDRAQAKLKEVLDSHGSPDASVRVAVIRGPHGCVHGWKLTVEDLEAPDDTVVQAGNVRILVEPDQVEILGGASNDYREDAMGIGFIIEAPNTPPPMHEHGGGCRH
ncbi:MAG: iron-sulfur cluster assembly accessory protein [Dehalococcoidia bacterium]